MPPKAKKEKLSEEKIQEICLEYMTSQNRPYNAVDVALNCHEVFSKAASQKALAALADRALLDVKNMAKEGKNTTLIYCARQDQKDTLSPEGVIKLDEELVSVKAQVTALVEVNKQLASEVTALYGSKSTEELEAQNVQLDGELARVKGILEAYEGGCRKLYTAEEVKSINSAYELYRKAHKKHKKEFEDIFAAMCEGLEKSKQESLAWREELGIDEVEEDPDCRWVEDPFAQMYKRSKMS